MLYTDQGGTRRIMVLNYVWKVAKNLFNYFKSADVDNCAQFKIRHTSANSLTAGARKTREKLMNDMVNMLYNYRKMFG